MFPTRRPRVPPQLIRLIALACAWIPAATSHAQDWAPNLTVTSTWQDNATNAKPAGDQISALQFEADMVASKRYSAGRDDSLHPTAHFAGEWWPRFNGLNRAAAGARLEWRHKFGLGAFAPVFSIEGGADVVVARESGRRGTFTMLLATVRKRLNDLTRFTLTQEFSDYNARAAVFDRQGAETAAELGRELTTSSRVTLRISYRDGDVLSHATPPRPDLVALAPNLASIDTFGRPLTAYSIEARTFGARVGVIRAVDADTALMAAYEVRQTRREPLRYLNQLVSVAIVYQF